MALMIKRGSTIPSVDDLKEYQLGFNKSNRHLYIKSKKDNGDDYEIIDLNSGTIPSKEYEFSITLNLTNSDKGTIIATPSNFNADNVNSSLSTLLSSASTYTQFLDLNFDNDIRLVLFPYRYNDNGYYGIFAKKLSDKIISYRALGFFDTSADLGKGDLSDSWTFMDDEGTFYWSRPTTIIDFTINDNIRYYIDITHPTVVSSNVSPNIITVNYNDKLLKYKIKIIKYDLTNEYSEIQPGSQQKVN
jgi:hypothetical protein